MTIEEYKELMKKDVLKNWFRCRWRREQLRGGRVMNFS